MRGQHGGGYPSEGEAGKTTDSLALMSPESDSSAEEGFDAVEVLLGVDADGVEVGRFDVDVDVVFEEAELF